MNVNIPNQHRIMKPIKPQTIQRTGKWVEKPRISEILICPCNNKYIKTRKDQITCIKCMVRLASLK